MVKTLGWSRFTNVCDECHRRYRISHADIKEHRAEVSEAMGRRASPRDVAAVISLCGKCIYGPEGDGDYIEDNPHARRWDPKGWALDVLARMVAATMALENAIAERKLYPATQRRLLRRLSRCAFLGDLLRDRIDGRY